MLSVVFTVHALGRGLLAMFSVLCADEALAAIVLVVVLLRIRLPLP